MRVGNPKLVVEPGAGRTGKLAMVAYQFQQKGSKRRLESSQNLIKFKAERRDRVENPTVRGTVAACEVEVL
jgi:hypothetical protein